MKAQIWNQIAAAMGVRSDDAEGCDRFFALFDNLQALQSEEQSDALIEAYARGVEFSDRLHADDLERGRVAECRRQCAERGEPVPAWVSEAEARHAANSQALRADLERTRQISDRWQAETTSVN